MLVEQAIFTSSQTGAAAGYQLVAATAGIGEADCRELSAWGPSHDSLWEAGPAATSVNFHRLGSGAYCVSQTMPAGAEFSQRRGLNVYTQSLVVSAEGLARFGNNPFALLQAAVALGEVSVLQRIPKRLEPFRLEPPEGWVDPDWLSQLIRHPGPVWLGSLLQTVLSQPAVGIVAGDRGASLVAALMNCVPMECRPAFSFCTGLRFSPRRPFRVICLPNNPTENRRLARQHQFTLLELKSPPTEPQNLRGWASFVSAMITSGNTEYLAVALAQSRPGLTLDQVDLLGTELARNVHRWRSAQPPAIEPAKSVEVSATSAGGTMHGWQRADGSHDRLPLASTGLLSDETPGLQAQEVGEFLPTVEIEEEPARTLARHCPAAHTQLQQLEDAIFEAIAGKSQAVLQLQVLWRRVLEEAGSSHGEAVREQFLRYTLSVWRQLNLNDAVSDPQRAAHALDVICLLFDR